MRLIHFLLLIALLPCAVAAQDAVSSATPPALDTTTHDAMVKLGGQLMLAGKAYEYDRMLSDELGPRLTGSDNYMKAADWATGEFKRLGLVNVHEDPWEISDTWEPEVWATGQIVAPREMRLHLESDGWSPSTPQGGIKGNVYRLKALTADGIKAESAQIKGSIVLLDRD